MYNLLMTITNSGMDPAQSRNVGPRSSDPLYIVTYYIKWVTISRTDDR